MEIFGGILALTGSVFLFLAALGLIRMPDFYDRMQAGTKATTLGTMLFLTGMALAEPQWAGKSALLILFVLYSNPLSSHALARAAHHAGISLGKRAICDELAADVEEETS
jgi:multicomponent Na+:H+ antiporter subunit G